MSPAESLAEADAAIIKLTEQRDELLAAAKAGQQYVAGLKRNWEENNGKLAAGPQGGAILVSEDLDALFME